MPALIFALLLALTAPAHAQELSLTTATPETLEQRVRATGWGVVGQPIVTEVPEYRSWIWAIAQNQEGGAVGLYSYREESAAAHLVEILSANRDAAVTRQGPVVLSVIMTGHPEEARTLLQRLTGVSLAGAPLPPEPLTADAAAPKVLALPELRFGALHRAEVLHAALLEGWSLSASPLLSETTRYEAVTWPLHAQKQQAFLTLYACRDDACVREVEGAARRNPDAATLRKQRAVLVLLTPGQPRAGQAVLKRLR